MGIRADVPSNGDGDFPEYLNIVQEEMAVHKATKLKTIRLVVGEAVTVNPQRLCDYFEVLSQDTPGRGDPGVGDRPPGLPVHSL
ncbi:MAG: hypothetical protein HY879_25985 [Deltaproteobacteria bacterium]|nr:hypothetical protein [Deltaproteobacteria bacterium]